MEPIQILIWAHAGLGGIALVCGTLALIFKKGSKNHKKSGIVFFYAMLASAGLALVLSVLPNHESPFLFTVGIFSSYFLLTGLRALRFKTVNPNLKLDKVLSVVMILTAIGMIAYPIISRGSINIILTVFGLLGGFLGVSDLLLYRKPEELKARRIRLHLGKMMGGYISAVTAFVVVNQVLPPLVSWLAPGLIGGFYIAYWMRKMK